MTAQLQQKLLQKEKMALELQETVTEKGKLLKQVVETQKGLLNLTWRTSKAAPHGFRRGSAAVHGNTVFFRPARAVDKSCVSLYNADAEEWSTLPQCPKEYFTLTVVKGLVTAVGGMKSGRHTNTLLSFVEEQWKRKWVKRFPHMPTQRALTAAVCSGKALVVAGGWREGDRLTTVDEMDTDTLQWSSASSLPHGLSDASATICGDSLYLVAGIVEHGHSTKTVLTCSLSALLQSQPSHSVWHTVADLSVVHSTCFTLNGQLLAVGGQDSDGKKTNAVYMYNIAINCWEVISHMPTARCDCLVAVLRDNKLMVVGGTAGPSVTDKVELATVQ